MKNEKQILQKKWNLMCIHTKEKEQITENNNRI